MKKILVLLFCIIAIATISCKKKKNEETSFSLKNTNWQLYYKSNNTFNFFALSHLSFKADYSVINYRNSDTLSGTWELDNSAVSVYYRNGDVYKGTLITTDSMSGTFTAFGSNGIWYAVR